MSSATEIKIPAERVGGGVPLSTPSFAHHAANMFDEQKSMTMPWQFTQRFARVTSIDRMVVEDCLGNERNPVVNGRFDAIGPGATH